MMAFFRCFSHSNFGHIPYNIQEATLINALADRTHG